MRLHDLVFLNSEHGLAVGEKWQQSEYSSDMVCCVPVLLETVDGGISWIDVPTGIPTGRYYSIAVIDGLAYIGGEDQKGRQVVILRFDPKDRMFSQADIQIEGVIRAIRFLPDGSGWAVGTNHNTSNGLILKTSDQETWRVQSHPGEIGTMLNDVAFSANGNAIVSGRISIHDAIPVVLITDNAGNSWSSVSLGLTLGNLSKILTAGNSDLYLVGSSGPHGLVSKSSDGGSSWSTSLIQRYQVHLEHLTVLSDGSWIVVGNDFVSGDDYRSIVKVWISSDAGVTWSDILQIAEGQISAAFYSSQADSLYLVSYTEAISDASTPDEKAIDLRLHQLVCSN